MEPKMRNTIVPIMVAALVAAAVPATGAVAGIPGVDLPRLDFPAGGSGKGGPVGQGCAAPATISGTACGRGRG
jgi:hypothetical protein